MEKLKERLTFGDLRLSERFEKGDVHLLIHFGAKDSPEEWVACLTPVLPIEVISLKQIVFSDGDKKAVFVDVVRVVEAPEKVIPTLIRFDRVDPFFRVFPHSLYFSSFSSFIFVGTDENGETSIPARLRAGTPYLDKLMGKMIEGTPKVLDDVPSHSEELETGNRQASEILDGLSRLRVFLGSDYVRVGFAEEFRLPFEVREVLFGPFDLHLNGNQSLTCCERHKNAR
jgi:hypothetical protein